MVLLITVSLTGDFSWICRIRNTIGVPRMDASQGETGSEMTPCFPYWISLYSCVCVAGTTVDFPAVSLATCFSVQPSKIWAGENSLWATHLTVSKRELCVEALHMRQMCSSTIKMKNSWAEPSPLAIASSPDLKECREPCKFKLFWQARKQL